jgi:hypothetical protein
LNLLDEFHQLIQHYELYYYDIAGGRKQNKKLQWIPHLGNAMLMTQIGGRKVGVTLSTKQACILLLFNSSSEWLVKDIATKLGMTLDLLLLALRPLVYGKYRILKRTRPKMVIEDSNEQTTTPTTTTTTTTTPTTTTTTTTTTTSMASSSSQMNVEPASTLSLSCSTPTPSTPLSPDDCLAIVSKPKTPYPTRIKIADGINRSSHTNGAREAVTEDRRFQVDAVIVRLLKTNKRMHQNDIIPEATKLLLRYFSADPLLIKQRIVALIEQEYLELDETDNKIVKYLV